MGNGHSSLLNLKILISRNDIQLCIVGIDEQLNGLYDELGSYPSPLRYRVTRIRNDFFRLSNYIEDCDIDNLTNAKPGEHTPIDRFWSNVTAEK